MVGAVHMKLAILVLAMTWIHCLTEAKRSKFPVDRSYQLSPVAVVNGAQGIQYYATGPVFAGVPAVLATPGQIGINAIGAPSIPSFVLPAHAQKPPPPEYYESSPPPPPQNNYQPSTGLGSQNSNHEPSYHFTHKPKIRSHGPISYKRPGSYINSVHVHPSGPKHTVGLSGYTNHKTSFTVQPSIDLTEHQSTPPSFFASTIPPPAGSTYGPPKPVEFQHKPRPPTGPSHLYHRHKGPGHTHRISLYSPNKMRVYSHLHNGHIHNHYVPVHSTPLYKSQLYSPKPTSPTFIKPSTPPYLPPSVEAPSTGFGGFSQENSFKPESQEYPKPSYNFHAHPQSESNHIRFPDTFESTKISDNYYNNHQTESSGLGEGSRPHEELTQAIIKETGVINNHDASLPLKIPTQKPNQFQVRDILKNADIHYVDGNEQPQSNEEAANNYENHNNNVYERPTSVQFQEQQTHFQYQQPQIFDPNQQAFQAFAMVQSNPESIPNFASNHQGVMNHLEYFNPRVNPFEYSPNLYQSNHLQGEQELGTSDSVKIPVAIFRGIQDTNGQGMFALAVKRSDESATDSPSTDFTPSRLSSDWIPMSSSKSQSSGPRAERLQSSESVEAVTYGKLDSFGDQYFAGLTTNREKKDDSKQRYTETTPIITSNRNIGDIISGKIPQEYAPFKTNEKTSNIRTIDTKNGRDSDIVTGKISFGSSPSSERDRRKGSVIDDYTGLSPEGVKFGDTSNLVVSSVIKFS